MCALDCGKDVSNKQFLAQDVFEDLRPLRSLAATAQPVHATQPVILVRRMRPAPSWLLIPCIEVLGAQSLDSFAALPKTSTIFTGTTVGQSSPQSVC